MDIPLDSGAGGRSDLNTNWVFYNYPIDAADQTSGFATGKPGVTIDTRTSGQPQYSNNTASGAATDLDVDSDNTDNNALAAPTGPIIFIATKSGTNIDSFIRLAATDLPGGIGAWIRWVCTGEKCDSPDGGRFIFCSPFYDTKPG